MKPIEYLHRKGIVIKRKRGNELIFNCPFCEDSNFKGAMNAISGAYNCLRQNHCGVRYSFSDFQRRFGDKPVWQPNESNFMPQRNKKNTYTKPDVSLEKPKSEVIKYLNKRGFSDKTIKFFKIGEKNSAVAIPYFKDGKLINVKYRPIEKKKDIWTEKNPEPTLFNRDNIDLSAKTLLICEGEYDCMAFYEYGIESVSIPYGVNAFQWVDNEWDWLQGFSEYYICFDNDSAGNTGAEILSNKLEKWKCRKVILPYKDANDCLKNKVSVEDMVSCISEACDFAPDMLTSPDFYTEEIIDLMDNPNKLLGIPTAWGKLNKLLGGWRQSELTIWSGQSGSGKSTILNQHIISLVKRDVNVCIASLEMPPVRYLRWMLLQYTGRQFPSHSVIRDALSWLTGKLYIINSTESMNIDTLLGIFEYAARRYNAQHFIIDSLMRIDVSGENKWEAQKEFITKLLTFSKKFCAHVHLVAHSRKSGADSDTPDKMDVKGSGDITDLAHNVLIMWRPPEDDIYLKKNNPDAILHVKKNRELGLQGSIGLFFNPEIKLFYDSKGGD
jgi:twinkle protein